jgi:hypothetical protein
MLADTAPFHPQWRSGMKLAYILAIMIAIPASSALAAPAGKAPSQPLLQAKPHDAYGRHRWYTDPDPNVQFEMMRQRNWRKG